jgi:spore maturation protein SpmA/spore maturation protein SpmB
MILNYIWIAFFVIAFIAALIKMIFFGDMTVFSEIISSVFDSSKTGFEISLGLTGVLTLWMGMMKIGERGGVVRLFSKAVRPFFSKLFPELPGNSPAFGSMMMNIAANMLGLDNAATPLGLKAMKELQDENKSPDTASNSQIMFLVLNASGLTLIPVSIMVYRAQLGAANPADIFIPILIATFFATMAGLISVSVYQKINLLNKTVLLYLLTLTAAVVGIILYMSSLSKEKIQMVSSVTANVTLLSIILFFIVLAVIKKVNVYEAFIEGAKDGFQTAIKIIPYLIAVLVAIAAFRASGAMNWLISGIDAAFHFFGINTDFVPALPTGFMKPLSGSGARGMMVDAMKQYGADSFVGRVASTIQGTTDTTFYIVAVYFGAVGIKNTRYAITCGLIADLAGLIAAVTVSYIFFH